MHLLPLCIHAMFRKCNGSETLGVLVQCGCDASHAVAVKGPLQEKSTSWNRDPPNGLDVQQGQLRLKCKASENI